MLISDNRCTYQMLQKELKIGFAPIHKIIHEELHVKKFVCHWVSHDLTEHQKAEHVRINNKVLQFHNDGGYNLISKIITGDEMCMSFFDIPTHEESEVWLFEDNPKPKMVRIQLAMKKVMDTVFF